MDNLIAPVGLKLGIYRCLKAGTNVGFPEQGTPQGGVVSPLLANIALNGIENIHHSVRYADDMVFNKETKQNRFTSKKLLEKAFPSVPYSENKFVNVKGEKSPYDADFAYWSQRESKLYDGETLKAAKKQFHECAHCGHKFMPGQRIHLHHKDGNHTNWKKENLEALHESCHNYKHMSKACA